MSRFSDTTNAHLTDAGVTPEFAAAIGLQESDQEEGVLQVPYGRHGRLIAEIGWEPGFEREVDDWPTGEPPGAWWPIGKASTVIVCAGAGNAVVLASRLFGLDRLGQLRRKANLPAVLQGAVPVALPATLGGLPYEWILKPAQGAEELFTELMGPDLSLVFLSLQNAPLELQPVGLDHGPALEAFIDAYLAAAVDIEVTPALALLPPNGTWRELLAPFQGAARTAALAGVLEYWKQVALAVALTKGNTT